MSTIAYQKKVAMVWYVVLTFVSGFAGMYLMPDFPEIPFGIVIIVISAIWCHLDAVERDVSLSRGLLYGIIFVPVVFVPIYLLLSRGRTGLIAIIVAVLILILGVMLAQGGAAVATSWVPS